MNFTQAYENITQSNSIASKIIEDAKNKAKFEEESAMKEVEAIQKQAIDEILKQQSLLTGETLDKAVIEVAEIVLKKVGMNVSYDELAKLVKQ